MANILTYSAIPASSQARQKPLNYRTQSLLHGRFLSRCQKLPKVAELI